MKDMIQISSTLSLPLDAVTQTLACIGRKGAGKTYLAQKLAEEMLDAQAQIVAIDAVGNWFGLRVGADGKSKGKDIFIAGGEHGDVPILPEAGVRFAKLVVEKNIPIILDVSGFRQGERKRFATDFGEEFFHLKKKQKSAVHLFIEEAQLFVPQRVGPEEARMLGAFENIIRLGRNYGIGATMISQRPQSVNKEVLSQVECLCVLQVNGTHERKALEEWVQEAGADRKLVGELPGLGRGEGYIWSPAWLRVFERVKFGKKTTFDASATPEVGKAGRVAMLSSVDVEALKADLQEVIAKADADSPVALKKRIAQLEADVRVKYRQTQDVTPPNLTPDPKQIDDIRQQLLVMANDYAQRTAALVAKRLREKASELQVEAEELSDPKVWKLDKLPISTERALKEVRLVPTPSTHASPQPAPVTRWPDGLRTPAKREPAPPKAVSGPTMAHLTGPEIRILNAIAWLESIGVNQPEQPAVAFLAGYTYGAGSYNNARGQLNQASLVEYVPGGRIQLTDLGRTQAQAPEAPGSNEELHQRIMAKLPGPEQRLLAPLLKSWPHSMHNETLAEKSGYTHGAGSFNNARGRLRSLGLIEYPQPGACVARDLLFPLGR